jgi:hypothetical protein
MASEAAIRRVLDLLTQAPAATLKALRGAREHARSMRHAIVKDPNVVAVGIGEKVSKRKRTGQLALTFYVRKKMPLKKLKADVAIPPTVPEALSGAEAIPTDVVVLGRLVPEVNATRTPVQPGNSIGHVDITAGTLGAVVTRGGSRFLLSNSHVLALSGKARTGDSIIYPGAADGGKSPADVVATLAGVKKFVTGGAFVNHADCAIAKPTAARLPDLVPEIKGLGLPRGTIKPRRGMNVVKVGRTTGETTGEIRDVNFRFVLDYDEVGEVGFIDQVLCTRHTRPGDSGSLVLDNASKKAVGLHFAGASGGSVFSPIGDVLEALGVSLVTRAGGAQAARRRKRTKRGNRATAKGRRR